jgi:hypothetical protein
VPDGLFVQNYKVDYIYIFPVQYFILVIVRKNAVSLTEHAETKHWSSKSPEEESFYFDQSIQFFSMA